MATTVSYPGVYIEELDSGVRVIAGVKTSITAFVGRARRGPVDTPVTVQGLDEYVRRFGGLWDESPMGHAVVQFFANGGSDALIVRVHRATQNPAGVAQEDRAEVDVPAAAGAAMHLFAADPGAWGNQLRVVVRHPEVGDRAFHLVVREVAPGSDPERVVREETFLNLTLSPGDARFVTDVLAAQSRMVRLGTLPGGRPRATPVDADGNDVPLELGGGEDGQRIGAAQVSDAGLEATRQGIYALETADLVNLLCIPPFAPGVDPAQATWDAAAAYCLRRRAMLLVDAPPAWTEPQDVLDNLAGLVTRSANAAIYFPRVRIADPLKENRLAEFAPCGTVAGVIARTDATRGVWKTPAGLEATLNGVAELSVTLTDRQHGRLNPFGVNCLRTFPVAGRVAWGGRTLRGADELADQWAYLSVRRTALFIEESLFRGTQWVVFEPNDETLWSQIRLNVTAFMDGLFRRGAFQGTTPAQAYLVRCDRSVNPQEDVDRGIVNIVVGFAPVKPAEFVLISIQQIRPGE